MSKWLEFSEIVSGLVITGKISKALFKPEDFDSPYNLMIKDFLDGMSKEQFYISHSNLVDTAKLACSEVIIDEQDWLSVLRQARDWYIASNQFKRAARELEDGTKPDIPQLSELVKKIEIGDDTDIIQSAKDVEPHIVKFKETGWRAFDKHLGGFPSAGMITLLAPPKTGKTTMGILFAIRWVKYHSDEVVLIFSIEMSAARIKRRMVELDAVEDTQLTPEQWDRIKIIDEYLTTEKMISVASTVDDVGLIVIDHADEACLVRGVIDEQNMTRTFFDVERGAKILDLPILFLAQPNDSKYKGGIPRTWQVNYTSYATKGSWMFMSIYNPHAVSKSFEDKDFDTVLPKTYPDGVVQAFVAVWLHRDGFPLHEKDSPGGFYLKFGNGGSFSPDDDRPGWIQLS